MRKDDPFFRFGRMPWVTELTGKHLRVLTNAGKSWPWREGASDAELSQAIFPAIWVGGWKQGMPATLKDHQLTEVVRDLLKIPQPEDSNHQEAERPRKTQRSGKTERANG
jgi:hypothetical protein